MFTMITSLPMDIKDKTFNEQQLEELCTTNGIPYPLLPSDGKAVLKLEMFFSGLTNMEGFYHFPNLERLVIIQQCLDCTYGLHQLPNLQELWICQCSLKKISNLDKCVGLKRLYLYNNHIKKIENLDKLKKLEVLWLNSNLIPVVENLQCLLSLKELNLADNLISKIGKGLITNNNLVSLNLSGNKITFLKDISPLCQLHHLEQLSFKDPNYLPSPVSLLWNYSLYVRYRMPGLKYLDTQPVHMSEVDQAVEYVIEKKVIFYDCKKKELENQKKCWLRAALELRKKLLAGYNMYVEQLSRLQNMLLKIPLSEEEKYKRQKLIEDTLDMCEIKQHRVTSKQYEAMHFIQDTFNFGMFMIDVELVTCGNVRFEKPTASCSWYDCCCDLVMDNFCQWDFKQHDITGIDILNVYKVTNRAISLRFDEALMSMMTVPEEGPSVAYQLNELKKKQDFLFWMPSEKSLYTMERVLQEGFSSPRYTQSLKHMKENQAFKLHNCLYFADQHRLKNMTLPTSAEFENFDLKFGQLLICRVYVGNAVALEDAKEITLDSQAYYTSYYKTKKALLRQSGLLYSVNDHPACRCLVKQKEWYIFNPAFIVPEYVVKFKYHFTNDVVNPFLQLKEPYSLDSNDVDKKFLLNWISLDENSYIQEKIKNLSEEFYRIYEVRKVPNPSMSCRELRAVIYNDYFMNDTQSQVTITHLNLCRQNLSYLNISRFLPSLIKLEASFNNLSSLELINCNLQHLKYLDVNWNNLSDSKMCINILKENAMNLRELNLSHNSWFQPTDLRIQLMFYLKNLQIINKKEVTESENQRVSGLVKRYHTIPSLLKRRSRLDINVPRILSLRNKAQILVEYSKWLFQAIDMTDEKLSKISSLCLDHCYLQGLSMVSKLPCLRWLSLDSNQLTTLEDLSLCVSLEELSATNNCIKDLGDLSKLAKLQKLHLAYNYLETLSPKNVTNLTRITYLSLEDNLFTSLECFSKFSCLQQLYVTNNKILNPREIIGLKNLKNLSVANFSGNQMTEEHSDYRSYVIFHLRGLHLLDGIPVEPSEMANAKELFGGCLTLDLITERVGSINNQLQELSLPNANIKTIIMGFADSLQNLTCLNLENNSLTSFDGLIYLENLKVLCLNNNRIECVLSPAAKMNLIRNKAKTETLDELIKSNADDLTFLSKLEILHLGYNEIKNLVQLQLYRIPSLKALFLQGNEITKVDGMEQLRNLSELILDANKIRTLSPHSFAGQMNLLELHLEENRVSSLAPLGKMTKLQRLYISNNKIQEVQELEHLKHLVSLTEISISNNPISRKVQARFMLMNQSSQLTTINGALITEEDRLKADTYFMERFSSSQAHTSDMVLPSISSSTLQLYNSSKQPILHISSRTISSDSSSQTDSHEKQRRILFGEDSRLCRNLRVEGAGMTREKAKKLWFIQDENKKENLNIEKEMKRTRKVCQDAVFRRTNPYQTTHSPVPKPIPISKPFRPISRPPSWNIGKKYSNKFRFPDCLILRTCNSPPIDNCNRLKHINQPKTREFLKWWKR